MRASGARRALHVRALNASVAFSSSRATRLGFRAPVAVAKRGKLLPRCGFARVIGWHQFYMTRWTGLREPHRRILGHVVGDWRPLAGSLRTASVGSSRVYIPQVFFCRSVRGFDPESGLSFLSSGSTDFVFCPPFCFGAASPGFGGFRLHSHDMHDLGSQHGGWFSPPPRAAPVGLCPSLL